MPTIRELREGLYLSRKDLAELADVSASSIARMEEGPGHVKQPIIEKVLAALSKRIGRKLTIHNVQVEPYNIIRDRKPRPKKKVEVNTTTD